MDNKTEKSLSYWKHPGTESLHNVTVNELLEKASSKFPDRIAVCSFYQNREFTFKEIHNEVQNFSAGLISLGLKKGEHVGIWAPNTFEWYISILAIINAGFVAVNINPEYQYSELEKVAKKTNLKALIIGEILKETNYYTMMTKIIPELLHQHCNTVVNDKNLPQLKILITMSHHHLPGAFRWIDVFDSVSESYRNLLRRIQMDICFNDVCNLQFTSGTTGNLKAACLTHFNIVNNSYFVGKRIQLDKNYETICLCMPFFHIFGTVFGILASIHFGSTLVIPSPKFSPINAINCIIDKKCTIIYGTPTMFIDLLTILNQKNLPNQEKVLSVKSALIGGAFCNSNLLERMNKYFSLQNIYLTYGMTESGGIFVSKHDDNESSIRSTVGCVLDHTEVKVINDNGRMVPFGTTGECCFRGHACMKEYYKDREMTKNVMLPGGWIRSGDRFILLENGYGNVTGRIKDIIIRGGENIEPSQIEETIASHPEVIDIQVFPVKDFRLGEEVAACIIKETNSSLSENDIRKFCDGKIARYKIPKYIEFVKDFPRTSNGKVMKTRLREQFESRVFLNKLK